MISYPTAWSAPVPESAAKTNRSILRTAASFYAAHNKSDQAIEVLKEHLKEDESDYESWNFLGLIAMNDGKLDDATAAFYEAAGRAPKELRGIYLYNYADSLVRNQKFGKSRSVLERAGEYAYVSYSSSRAIDEMRDGKPLPPIYIAPDASKGGSIILASGYDTNVLLVADESLSSVSSSDEASFKITPMLTGYYDMPSRDGILRAEGTGLFTYHESSSAEKYNTLYLGLGGKWIQQIQEPWNYGAGLKTDFTMLNTNLDGLEYYSWSSTFTPELVWREPGKPQWTFNLPIFYQGFADDPSLTAQNKRHGFGFKPGSSYSTVTEDGIRLGVGLRYEYFFAEGDNYKSHSVIVPASATKELFWGMMGSLTFEGSYVLYPTHENKRKDKILKPGVIFQRTIADRWNAGIDYSFKRNLSNVAAATYKRHQVGVTIVYSF